MGALDRQMGERARFRRTEGLAQAPTHAGKRADDEGGASEEGGLRQAFDSCRCLDHDGVVLYNKTLNLEPYFLFSAVIRNPFSKFKINSKTLIHNILKRGFCQNARQPIPTMIETFKT